MSTDTRMILSTSDEAAERRTVTGWVARGGQWWGDDERMARWSGATHVPCAECGEPVEKTWTKCDACRRRSDDQKWAARPRVPYDGGWVYAKGVDRFFQDEDELRDFLDVYDEHTCESLRLVPCEPIYAHEMDPDELFADELPEGCTVADIDATLDDLIVKVNERIQTLAKEKKPFSWQPGSEAVDIATLPNDLRRA